jgi:hypothetical protein
MKAYLRQTLYSITPEKKSLGFAEILADVVPDNKDKNVKSIQDFCKNRTIERVAGKLNLSPTDIVAPSKLVFISDAYYKQVEDGIKGTPLSRDERLVVINADGKPTAAGQAHYIMVMLLSPGNSLSEDLPVVSIQNEITGKFDDMFCPSPD